MTALPDAFSASLRAEHDGVDVLSCRGGLDLACADTLSRVLYGARGSRLIVDLTDVSFIDSMGLSILIVAYDVYPDGSFGVCGLSGPVRRLMELTGLHDVLPVSDSVQEAISELEDGLARASAILLGAC